MKDDLPISPESLNRLLGPTETIKLFVPVQVPEQNDKIPSILSIIVSTAKDIEEACIVVFSGQRASSISSNWVPILPDLRITTTQLQESKESQAADSDSQKSTDFAVTFSRASLSLSVVFSNHESLQDVLHESRRLMSIAGKALRFVDLACLSLSGQT